MRRKEREKKTFMVCLISKPYIVINRSSGMTHRQTGDDITASAATSYTVQDELGGVHRSRNGGRVRQYSDQSFWSYPHSCVL